MDVRNHIIASDFLDIKPVNDVFLHVEAFDIFGGYDSVRIQGGHESDESAKVDGAKGDTNDDDVEDAFDRVIAQLK